jgi:hypothetical protein
MAHMDRVDLRFPLGNVVIGLTEARLYGGLATHQLRIAAKVSATWLDDKASEPLLLGVVRGCVGRGAGLFRPRVPEIRCRPVRPAVMSEQSRGRNNRRSVRCKCVPNRVP